MRTTKTYTKVKTKTKQTETETESNRAEPNKINPNYTKPNQTDQNRTKPNRPRSNRTTKSNQQNMPRHEVGLDRNRYGAASLFVQNAAEGNLPHINTTRVFYRELGEVAFLVLCFLYKRNASPEKSMAVGKVTKLRIY